MDKYIATFTFINGGYWGNPGQTIKFKLQARSEHHAHIEAYAKFKKILGNIRDAMPELNKSKSRMPEYDCVLTPVNKGD